MPAYRIGVGSEFVLKNQTVGIGTQDPRATLDVVGTIKGDFDVSGITTLTSYGGFISQKQNVSTASAIGFNTTGIGTVGITSFISVNETETGFISLTGEFNTLSEDLIIDDGKILDVSTIRNIGVTTIGTQNVYVPTSTTVSLGTLESVNVTSHFSVPNGGINSRQQHPTEGMVRFNDDLNTLEFYNGVEWRQFTVDGSSGRGVFSGGASPLIETGIDYVNIASTGNAINFGSLATQTSRQSGCSSETRGLFGGGGPSPTVNTIVYITIASQGNAITFGTLSATRETTGACSSSTRGIWMGGRDPANLNVIDYVEIATLGNALDFGDLITARQWMACCSSPTRGIAAGGEVSARVTTIEAVTISSKGNSVYFGDLTQQRGIVSNGVTSGVRGVFGGGEVSPFITNRIDYITIATFGNATYFGDLTVSRFVGSGTSSKIRGIFAGGNNVNDFNTIDYVTIASTGNAQDFGDLTKARWGIGGVSDSHGGLGGF